MVSLTGRNKDALSEYGADACRRHARRAGRSLAQDALRRLLANKAAVVSIVVVVVIVLVALIVPHLLPWEYGEVDWTAIRKPPDFGKGPLSRHRPERPRPAGPTVPGHADVADGRGRRDRRLGRYRRHLWRRRRLFRRPRRRPDDALRRRHVCAALHRCSSSSWSSSSAARRSSCSSASAHWNG